MQREKGKRGELEVAKLLQEHGFEARRGQQYKGGTDSPDVIHNISNVFIEVKLREKLSLYSALEKAKKEGGSKTPIVFHRRDRKPWVIIMYADDFLGFLKLLWKYTERPKNRWRR